MEGRLFRICSMTKAVSLQRMIGNQIDDPVFYLPEF